MKQISITDCAAALVLGIQSSKLLKGNLSEDQDVDEIREKRV
jgi:hypothetical protein